MKFGGLIRQKWFVPAVVLLGMSIVLVSMLLAPKGQEKLAAGQVFTPKTIGQKLTAKEAWAKLSKTATAWASDVVFEEVFSTTRPGEKGVGGKPVGWNFKLYSKLKGKKVSYFVGLDGETVKGSEDSGTEFSTSHAIFTLDDWVVDSSQAFEIADANGGSSLKDTADYDAVYDLKVNQDTKNLEWTIWYPSPKAAKLTIKINAKTGDPIAD